MKAISGMLTLGSLGLLLCLTVDVVAVPFSRVPTTTNTRTHHFIQDDEEYVPQDVNVQDGVINVHIVPHTHDDVGWLKTVDQYFAGKNESIQHAAVHQIISSAMDALAKNPNRKFIYVEIAFFWRWWQQQTDSRKQQVRDFVQNGQLEFINGGWCMHDEASTHFQSMIDQTTEGHTFIKQTFNVAPTVQWQIDPFGHSSTNADLSLQMGFTSLFFGRADYADVMQRQNLKQMELLWFPSQSTPAESLFTHILYRGYGPPSGLNFDVDSRDDPIQDDTNISDYNVDSRLNDFLVACQDRAAKYQTSNIIMTMGSDFQYRQADDWFDNLDKMIKYANANLNASLNVFYSTPSLYAKAVLQEAKAKGLTFPPKSDDFFPYGDGPHAYWTGYFTSRPALKRYERYAMAYLQACKQIEATSKTANATWTLREAMGVAQHHDAVSGTEKQHVAFDYAKRIAAGISECETMMNQELATAGGLTDTFVNCHLLNVSVCAQTASRTSGSTTLLIYNSLSVARQEFVRIPIATATGASVVSSDGTVVTTQVVDNTPDTIRIGSLEGGKANTGNFTLVFQISVPARGSSHYTINFSQQATHPFTPAAATEFQDEDFSINNNFLELGFSSNTGKLAFVSAQGIKVSMEQDFLQYYSSPGTTDDPQPSGAYIFRPIQISADQITPVAQILSVVRGPIVQEVRQVFSTSGNGGFVVQTVRLYKDQVNAEFEWTVGPISLANGLGKEVVTRFNAPAIASNGAFYTDSNGREMQMRVRNKRATWNLTITEPVSQNYYPVNTAMYLEDSNARLTLVTDRSQGGGSLEDGSMEIMVHRRTVVDDKRGVAEPISEPGIDGKGLIVRGSFFLLLSSPANSPALHKDLVQRTTYAPLLSFSSSSSSSAHLPVPHSFMTGELPSNVHLLTLQALTPDRTLFLVRLNHIYQVGEGSQASTATVSLNDLFPGRQIQSVTELMLSGNQPVPTRDSQAEDANTVTLTPMQIRTFHVQF
eukprot:c10160_g2_i1.p1 GENE.c10160_g2_i1~~c10160_g2_i1.p1  ORF type:complete len:1006 (+),score=235.35 c10160_g2_i1:43-3018(+)